ncbi:gibberellin-regulated protein 11-like [Apium graveolens]|uniref:gibberellin-regulated protein 11-like n=1 Tax=Apium graveolens TaxID=4045 RepID=UPI003D78C4BA
MATSKSILISLLLSLFVVQFARAHDLLTNVDASRHLPVQNIDCGGLCAYRCHLSSRPNLCNRACGTCCARCNCVPPGTSGNEDVCPCYAHMTTHGGRHKCP